MAKEDLKLRVTSNAPLTTKGSALTWAELDANWIAIYNAFLELSQSSYIADYSAAVTYDDTINNYVMYNSQLWKCIAASPIIAITPVEGVNWTKKYATDMAGRTELISIKKTLTADEINNGFSSKITIVEAKGVGFIIEPIAGAIKYNHNTVAFDAAKIYIKLDGADNNSGYFINVNINGGVSFFNTMGLNDGPMDANHNIVISFNADGSSSPLGDGTIDIYMTYKITAL